MTATLGQISLITALALSAYSIVASILGIHLRQQSLLISGRRAIYLTSLILFVATLSLVTAFLDNQFNIKYVAEHSNLSMPRIYTWVAFYAGNEGSLLYIAFSLSAAAAVLVRTMPYRLGNLRPYTTSVLMAIQFFFLAVMVFLANPFAELNNIPRDGQGINPLLQHPGMFIHPPMLMSGLIIVSIPFALAMGAMLSGRVDDDWVDIGRMWGIIAWAILGTGLLLGAWWAYTILGWGGYWAWDPVENAAFMPWLALTAFIHSIMVQKRRGMFRLWNMVLINVSFILACFGMFINRGGSVPSVHSFGASTLGWVFLAFLAVVTIASFGLFIHKLSILKSNESLESTLSREASFLVNNLLLLAIAFITLWGVMFPLLSQFFGHGTITVGEPFYNQVNGPIMIALVFLMGVGPLLPWRNSSLSTLKKALIIPGSSTILIAIILLLAGINNLYPLIAFSVSTMVAVSVFQEWIRGTIARNRSSGEIYPVAFFKLIISNRPRYGGYIVHLAIVLLAFGIIGSSFYSLERDVMLSIGNRASIGSYEVEFTKTEVTPFPDRTERTATVTIFQNSKYVGTMDAWQGVYPSFRMLSTRAAIRSTPVEDVYVLFSEVQPDGQSAAFRLLVNPLVWWMWVAGPVMLLGTVVALWPSRRRTTS